jgi:anaerobic selenocysteine-containing dehydrogenase
MLNTIINENLYDADFVTNWTQGFEELQSYVQEFSPEIVEQITDISAETIRGFARQYATTPRACIFTSRSALGQHSNGIDTLRLLYFLIAITGHIDTPGGNLFHDKKPSLWPTNGSAQSTAIPISSSVNLGQVTRLSSEQPERLSYPVPSRVGVPFPYPDFMWMLFNGEIKALYSTGQNFLGVPNNKVAFEKLREIPFIAVSDLFMTPIADIADVIIPGSSYLERMKVVTTGKYYYGVRVTEPMPNILTEMTEEDASFMLMKKLGLENDFPYSSWEDQINKRELPALGIPITAQEMIEQFPEGLAIPVERKYKKYEDGLIRSDGRPGFDTPSTKFELHSVEAERFGYNPVPKWWVPWELREEEREEYPLILDTTARTWFYGCARSGHINSYNAVSYLSEMVPEPLLILNEQDAYDRGIKDGDWVVVTSRCSSTEVGSIKLKAHIPYPHGDTMPGVCGMYDGFVEALGSNLLPDLSLPEAYDKISGMPPFRGILVEVRKA